MRTDFAPAAARMLLIAVRFPDRLGGIFESQLYQASYLAAPDRAGHFPAPPQPTAQQHGGWRPSRAPRLLFMTAIMTMDVLLPFAISAADYAGLAAAFAALLVLAALGRRDQPATAPSTAPVQHKYT